MIYNNNIKKSFFYNLFIKYIYPIILLYYPIKIINKQNIYQNQYKSCIYISRHTLHNYELLLGLFTLNKYEQCKKKEYKTLHQIDRKQNAIFLFQHGDDCFSTLNALFFNNKLNALNLNKTLYQSAKNYTFKDKKYLYKCTPIKVKCLRVFLSEKELIHFIAFNQYTFNFDNIPVYIIQEIIN